MAGETGIILNQAIGDTHGLIISLPQLEDGQRRQSPVMGQKRRGRPRPHTHSFRFISKAVVNATALWISRCAASIVSLVVGGTRLGYLARRNTITVRPPAVRSGLSSLSSSPVSVATRFASIPVT